MQQRQTIIFHIDGDAFFASCEQSTQLSLRNKPIAVGRERGIATAFSYEAKKLGVSRGMSGMQIKQQFPEVSMVSSDYRKYGLYSRRFKNIVRTYTDYVEDMSIDECYADMTDIVGDFDQAARLASIMQHELSRKLGMTFSIGIGVNKVIAKIASGMNKPCGVTNIPGDKISNMLYHKSISTVSGVGVRSVSSLNRQGIYTIGDFCNKSSAWVGEYCAKPYRELYRELHGEFVRPLDLNYQKPQSISKIRAFKQPSSDSHRLISEFSRNAEIVAKKMYRENVQGSKLSLGMKTPNVPGKGITIKGQEMFSVSIQLTPDRPIRHTQDIIDLINQHFDDLYVSGHLYRATYIGVYNLKTVNDQLGLFEDDQKNNRQKTIAVVTNSLEKKYGDGVLHRAVSLNAMNTGHKLKNNPNSAETGGTPLITSREGNKVLEIPYLGVFS